MNRTVYDELFNSYWQWLLERFERKERLEYTPKKVSPGKGNARRVKKITENLICLIETKETTSRGNPSKCTISELREDFWKLSNDPAMDVKGLRELAKEHSIINFVEFKRHMFEEFRQFSKDPLTSQNIPEDTVQNTYRLILEQEEQLVEQKIFDPSNLQDARERTMASIVRRRGQPLFRRQLLIAYEGKCAISKCSVEEALDAAHITPYQGPETNHPSNGLLLRTDLHTLFDLGLIAIESENMTVLIAPSLRETCYQEYAGKPLYIPKDSTTAPNKDALKKHRRFSGISNVSTQGN